MSGGDIGPRVSTDKAGTQVSDLREQGNPNVTPVNRTGRSRSRGRNKQGREGPRGRFPRGEKRLQSG